MAISLSSLTKTKRDHPPVLAFHGTGGIGKTSLASEFPDPLYVFTEGEAPPADVEMTTLQDDDGNPQPIKTFSELLDVFDALLTQEHEFKTVIIDSLDALEKMVWAHTCARMGWESIDSNDKGSPTAFGKGYLEADNDWLEYITAIRALARSGLYVVQILHSEVKQHNDPVVDPYDRYRPKLQKRACDIIIEKSDALLFIHRKPVIKQVDKSFGKKESKADGMSGSERIVYTDERAGFLAKNRLNMPASFRYVKGSGFTEMAKYFGGGT